MKRATTISLLSLAPLRLTHRCLLSPTPGRPHASSRSPRMSHPPQPSPGLVWARGVGCSWCSTGAHRRGEDCRERAQVQHKGMEADILLLSPPHRCRLSRSSSGLGTSCCYPHPVKSLSGLRISSLPLRDLLQWMMRDSLVLFIMILNEGENSNHGEEKSGR